MGCRASVILFALAMSFVYQSHELGGSTSFASASWNPMSRAWVRGKGTSTCAGLLSTPRPEAGCPGSGVWGQDRGSVGWIRNNFRTEGAGPEGIPGDKMGWKGNGHKI